VLPVAILSLASALAFAPAAPSAAVRAVAPTSAPLAAFQPPAKRATKSSAKSTKSTKRATPQRRRSSVSKRRSSAASASSRTAAASTPRATTPRTASALASDLGALLNSHVRSGKWGVMVVSLTRGDTLYADDAGAAMLPASTMKLMTTALAFDHFGPRHRLSTDVLREGAVGADGTLAGNLVIRGGGDPSLSGRFYRGGPQVAMDSLAALVAAAGVKRVRGDIVGDASAFDDKRIPDGWLTRYLGAGYAARVSPLSVNENVAIVRITPGSSGAVVALEPASSTIPVVNHVKLTKGSGGRVTVRAQRDGTIEARGWIGSRSSGVAYQVVMDDPALYTTGAFRAALVARGIAVDGKVRLGRASAGAVRVTSLQSQPLGQLAALMNRESINHYAELLFRDVAHDASPSHVGSAEAGNALLRQFLSARVGVDTGAVYAADGSGLSTLDRITARSMVKLLAYAHRSPWGADFHASLPVAGESELLRHRMKYTPAQGNLHAKTGTTNEVIGLAGYVTAQDGEVIAFAFLYNGTDRWNAKSAIDASGATLAGFARD
jgi:D-alanyl-D-alanine carboxypeptidase/D-alanyl-D-alanine-endopeptidase (penicillin-binding protein 4)